MRRTTSWIWARFAMLIAISLLIISCSNIGNQTATPTPTVTQVPLDIVGGWTGCIQGTDGFPNENIALNITSKQVSSETFSGQYTEDYQFNLVLSINLTANNAQVFNTHIDRTNDVQFSALVHATVNSPGGGGTELWTYRFQGILSNQGTMNGKVLESGRGGTPTLSWTLSRNAAKCPY